MADLILTTIFHRAVYLKNAISNVPTTINKRPKNAFLDNLSLNTKYENATVKIYGCYVIYSFLNEKDSDSFYKAIENTLLNNEKALSNDNALIFILQESFLNKYP